MLLPLLLLGVSSIAVAKFAHTWAPVPTDRLIRNLSGYVKSNPRDARGHYTLGRIHGLAFLRGASQVDVISNDWQTQKPLELPTFAPGDSILAPSQHKEPVLSELAKAHIIESLKEYGRALELEPDPLYAMGLGWMLEQGAQYAAQIGTIKELPSLRPTAVSWLSEALVRYRRAYAASRDKEAKEEHRDLNNPDHSISIEAGEGILRLRQRTPLSMAVKNEINEVRAHLALMNKKPGFITPIIFSRDSNDHLANLLHAYRNVSFDLAVNRRNDRWPWVRPDTGILVWDPELKGQITSGSQLFGSRTWEMFWRNGYEPLAALDDDKDGSLIGAELKGIAVWFDRNSNGRSEAGEVLSIESLGISRIAVDPTSTEDGVPANKRGLQFRDGTTVSTFDWTPQSIPDIPQSNPILTAWD